jgi:hypothetical protein
MSLWRLVCTALLCVEVAAAPARPLLVQNTGNIGLETHGRPPYLPNLYEAGVSDLQAFLSNGSFASVQLTEVRAPCWLVLLRPLTTTQRHTWRVSPT